MDESRVGLLQPPSPISANWQRWALTRRLSVCPMWPTWNPSSFSQPRSFPPANRSRLLVDKEPGEEAPRNKQRIKEHAHEKGKHSWTQRRRLKKPYTRISRP